MERRRPASRVHVSNVQIYSFWQYIYAGFTDVGARVQLLRLRRQLGRSICFATIDHWLFFEGVATYDSHGHVCAQAGTGMFRLVFIRHMQE